MSSGLRLRFCINRKGGIGGGGQDSGQGQANMGLVVENPWLALGGPLFLSSFARISLDNSRLAM